MEKKKIADTLFDIKVVLLLVKSTRYFITIKRLRKSNSEGNLKCKLYKNPCIWIVGKILCRNF